MREKTQLSALVESIAAKYDMSQFRQQDAEFLSDAIFQAYLEATEDNEQDADLDVEQLSRNIRNERMQDASQPEDEDPDAEYERIRRGRNEQKRRESEASGSPAGGGKPSADEREAVMKRHFMIIDALEQEMLKLYKIERQAASKLK